MDLKQKSEKLKKMFEQVAPESFDERNRGLESSVVSEVESAEATSGLERLAVGGTLRSDEAGALEAIIHKKHRPVAFVVTDTFSPLPNPWDGLSEPGNRQRIETAIKSIGRIELPGSTLAPYGGTGFVVGDGLIMTNRHVAEQFARGLGQRGLAFRTGRAAAINFRREVVPSPEVANLTVKKVEMIHPYWDMALLRVSGLQKQHKPLTLSVTHADDLVDNEIVVIGYPAQDGRNDIALQNQIFGGVYDVKRMQPGILRARRRIESYGNEVNAVTHDASTLGGNSGSAVIDVASGVVVALHFAGLYLDANFAVPTFELGRDSRVVDAGINFEGSIDATADWKHRWDVADTAIESQTQNSPTLPRQTVAHHPSTDSASFTIPLNVTISIGSATRTGEATVRAASVQEGLFGGGDDSDEQTIERAYAAFDRSSIDDEFSWSAALSTCAASDLIYDDDFERVKRVCQTDWQWDTCDVIRVNDTECFVASTSETVLVAFRGTKGFRDWLRDLNLHSIHAEYGHVHSGFYHGFQQTRGTLTATLERINAGNKELVLTGHSLGGALATIAAAEWFDEFTVSAVYTFGQPAVGKSDFKQHMSRIEGRFHRIVNNDDVVARVPPGYEHVGKLIHFDSEGTVQQPTISESVSGTLDSSSGRMMMDEFEFRALQDQFHESSRLESAGQGVEGFLFPNYFSDHGLVRYMEKILKQ